MEIYAIGLIQETVAEFFGLLRCDEIERLVDVRVDIPSQVAAFARRDDLTHFLREFVGADYVRKPLLAPTKELLQRIATVTAAPQRSGFTSTIRIADRWRSRSWTFGSGSTARSRRRQ